MIGEYNGIINKPLQQVSDETYGQSNEDVVSTKIIFSVQGMTCSACVNTIEQQIGNYFTDMLGKGEEIYLKKCNVTLVIEEGIVEYEERVNKGQATHDTTKISDDIREVVEDCGFDCTIISEEIINTNTHNEASDSSAIDEIKIVHFQVYGMTCSACTSAIENAVVAITGVDTCNVQLLTQVCEIQYHPAVVSIKKLVETIEDCGFDCVLQEHDNDQQIQILKRVEEIRYWKKSVIRSGISSILVMFIYVLLPKLMMEFIVNKSGTDQSMDNNTRKSITGIFPYVQFGIPGLYLSDTIALIVSSYVQFVLGKNFYKSTFAALKHRTGTMDTLVCLSTTIVYCFSVISMLRNMIIQDTALTLEQLSVGEASVFSPPAVIMPNVLFETSCMLIAFISLGKFLENKAKAKTSTALSKFMTMTPPSCLLYDQKTNTSKEIDVNYLEQNDLIEIKPGMRIPCDGIIIEGESEVDESIITGESSLVHKQVKNEVIQGSINGSGYFIFRALKVGESTKLAQIIRVMKMAQLSKAPIQKYADYVASKFVPAILALSVLTFVTWVLICKFITVPAIFLKNQYGYMYMCFQISISVVVVACPCALGLAAPTSIIVGTGVAANNGVLLKGGEILQNVSELDCFIFDKTGTLTTGEMNVDSFEFLSSDHKTDTTKQATFWEICQVLEKLSEHPIAKSILSFINTQLTSSFENAKFTVVKVDLVMGQGIRALVENVQTRETLNVRIGNLKIFQDSSKLVQQVADMTSNGDNSDCKTVTYVSIDDELIGKFLISDTYKKDAHLVIQYLTAKQYEIYMCTGDNRNVALKVAKDLGIAECNVFYEISPIEKANIIKDLQENENKKVGFIGDGVNDSVALVQADIGISVSNGTDIAIEASDIVLLQDVSSSSPPDSTASCVNENSLKGLVYAIDISIRTFKKVKSNFFWSIVYNMMMLPIAMGALVPFQITLHPMFAGAAMICSSISVVLNSLLLKRWTKPDISESTLNAYKKSIVLTNSTEPVSSWFANLKRFRFSRARNSEDNQSLVSNVDPLNNHIEMEQV